MIIGGFIGTIFVFAVSVLREANWQNNNSWKTFVVVDGMGSVIRRRRSRHTMSALVCGLDVHKDSTYATILDSEGKIVDQTRMENEKVPSYLSHHGVCKVAMESSTAVAPLYRQLKKEGFDTVVSHPKKTKSSRRLKLKAIAYTLKLLRSC